MQLRVHPPDGTPLGLHCFAMHCPFNETPLGVGPCPSDGTPNPGEACEACEACEAL